MFTKYMQINFEKAEQNVFKSFNKKTVLNLKRAFLRSSFSTPRELNKNILAFKNLSHSTLFAPLNKPSPYIKLYNLSKKRKKVLSVNMKAQFKSRTYSFFKSSNALELLQDFLISPSSISLDSYSFDVEKAYASKKSIFFQFVYKKNSSLLNLNFATQHSQKELLFNTLSNNEIFTDQDE